MAEQLQQALCGVFLGEWQEGGRLPGLPVSERGPGEDDYPQNGVRRRALTSIACLSLFLGCAPSGAQELFEPSIHWAYASYFGTGWYKLDEQQSAFVFSTAPRWTFGEAGFSEDGSRSVQYTLRLPLMVGLSRLSFDDIPGTVNPDNLSTLAAGISFDADVPINRRFSVRPNAEISYGGVIGEEQRAWSYKASMRGRFAFEPKRFDWALILDGGFVGYDATGFLRYHLTVGHCAFKPPEGFS